MSARTAHTSAAHTSPTFPPPSRRTIRAAYASALSATVGFIPLHAVWALGIPLWADPDRFDTWYAEGGGPYLFVLNAMAALAGLLALSLVRPWGHTFPAWLPLLRGHRVPPRTLTATAYTVATALLAYTAFATYRTFVEWNDPGVFSRWIAVYGIPQFLVWGIGLFIAARSYGRRASASPLTSRT
ncbi:hypothetical protein ACIBI4_18800 [Streptomyces sp. NPDC050418]|uniref:hypothetical protein n=1 Tax=Streptomyces sp. NPDC050418 TaxID=3365612 RepID=UPI0037BDB61B